MRGDTRRYRTFHLHQQLTYAGVDCQIAHITTPGIAARAAAASLLVLHRVPMDGYVEKLIRSVRARGGIVLYDTDDLIFDPSAFQWIHSPDFQDPIRVRVYQAEMRRQRQTLDDRRNEETALRARFQSDIDRYRLLRSSTASAR